MGLLECLFISSRIAQADASISLNSEFFFSLHEYDNYNKEKSIRNPLNYSLWAGNNNI